MKSRIYNPFRTGISAILTVLTLGCFAAPSARADTIYWDGISASWNSAANWTTDPANATSNPGAAPGSSDDTIFNRTGQNSNITITLNVNQAAQSLTFNSTGTTRLTGGSTAARTLAIGSGGITMASNAGAVTLGDGTADNNVLVNLSGAQTWTNNSVNAFTINNTAATFTRQTGTTLTFNKASTGNFAISTTAAPLVNGIIGPWAFFGTGADQRYAVSGATVTGLAGTSVSNVNSMTSASANYVYTAAGSTTAGSTTLTANTIRTSLANTIALSNSSGAAYNLTVNGILATADSGTFTISKSTTSDQARGIQIGSSGELVIAGQQAVNITAPIHEAGGAGRRVIYSGSNTLSLSGASTYTGGTIINSGTVSFRGTGLASSGNITFGGDSMLRWGTSTTADLSSRLVINNGVTATLDVGANDVTLTTGFGASGSGALTKAGSGSLTLSGANTYTGGTTVSTGTLALGHATNTLADGGAVTVDGATAILSIAGNSDTVGAVSLKNGAQITGSGGILTGSSYAVESGSVSAILGGAGIALTKTTAGTVTLSGSNTYTGATTVSAGTLELGHATDTLADGGAVTVDGATAILSIAGNSDTVGAVSLKNGAQITGSGGILTGSSYAVESGSVSAILGGAGIALTKTTAGTVTLSGSNTYTGATTVSAGTLELGHATDTLADGGAVTVDGATAILSIAGNSDTVGAVSLKNGAQITGSGGTLTGSSYAVESGSVSAILGGAGIALTKTAAGTVTLSGSNTYTGATNLSAGTLILNNATALGGNNPGVNGTSSISMAAGTTLRSNYIITDAGNVDSFVYAPITLTGSGTANFMIGAGNNTSPAEAVTFNLNGAIGGTAGTNVVFSTTGSLNNPDSTFVLGSASTYDGNTTITVGNSTERINVKADVDNALPTTTVLTFGNITGSGTGRLSQYDLNGNDQTLAGLSNGGNAPQLRHQRVTNSGALATLTINNATDYTFGGANTNGISTTRAQITGAIALVKGGAGTFTLGGTLANGATAGGNTFTGATKILGGILSLGETLSLQNSPLDTANSVTGDATNGLRTTVTTLRLGGLTGDKDFADIFTSTSGGYSGLTALTLNPGTAATHSYSGDIGNGAGAMTLTKIGDGTQVLSGANSYSGGTTISGGSLKLTNAGAAGSGGITLSGSNEVHLEITSSGDLASTNHITFSNTHANSSVKRTVAASADYTTGTDGNLKSSFAGGKPDTTAQLLGGTNSSVSDTILNMSFSASLDADNDGIRRSDVFNISGTTGTDAYVIQILVDAGLAPDSRIGWMDTVNNVWVNVGSILKSGAYISSYLNEVGSYGYDSGTSSVWAVVDHGGSFAAIPEPTTALAGLLLTAGLLRRRRRNTEC